MKSSRASYKERLERLEADKKERERVFKMLLAHLRRGYSLESFEELSPNTIKRYINLFKEEFVQEEIDEAMRAGRCVWEGIGYKQSTGECLGNSRSWYYNMANRYGWRDKIELEAEHTGQVQVQVVSYSSTKRPSQHTESAD